MGLFFRAIMSPLGDLQKLLFRQPEFKPSIIARRQLAVSDVSLTDMSLRANAGVAWQSNKKSQDFLLTPQGIATHCFLYKIRQPE